MRAIATAIPIAVALAAGLAAAGPAAAVDLPAALQAAMASDPTLASATANRDAAMENIAIARSKVLPQVSFQTSAQHLQQTTKQGDAFSDFSGLAATVQLNLRQGIYRPRDWAGMDIGQLQAQYGETKLVSAQSDLWSRTTSAWVDVLTAQALRVTYSRAVESIGMAADQETKRLKAGEGTREVLAEARAQLAQARAQLADAELQLQARLRAFNLLTQLGVPDFNGYALPPAAVLAPIPEPEKDFLARILDFNPELTASRLAVSVSERRLAQAAADQRPTLDLIGSLNAAQNDSTNTLGLKYHNSMIGVQFVLPIYAGGGLDATQRQVAAQYAAASADREALIQKLKTQFAGGWVAQTGLRERAEAALELVGAARELRRAAQFSIKSGLKTWADMGAADMLIARREGDYVALVGQLIKTQAGLLSMLPADDPAWARWVALIAQLSKS